MNSLVDKVKLHIFDGDLLVRKSKDFPISSDGSKIKVQSGGEAHFMPEIGKNTFLEFQKRSMFPPFKKYRERHYFVRNTAKRCVDFETEEVYGPDPEQVKIALGNEVASKWGSEKTETPIILWLILAAIAMVAAKVFGVIV